MWTKSCLSLILFFVVHTHKGCFVTTFFKALFFLLLLCKNSQRLFFSYSLFVGRIRHTFCVSFFSSRKTTTKKTKKEDRPFFEHTRDNTRRFDRRSVNLVVLRSSSSSSRVVLVVLKKKRPGTKARERQSIFIRPKKTTSNSNGRHPDADPNDSADGDSASE